MNNKLDFQFMVHSKKNNYKRKITEANAIVSRAFATTKKAYVAFSGGKDSTVLLHLVKKFDPEIKAIWSDDEWVLPETEEYMQRVHDNGINLIRIRTNAVHASWFKISGDWDSIQHYAKKNGLELSFIGLRKKENSRRKMHLGKFGPLFFAKSDGLWHCNPILNWSVMDIWTYIFENKLDYNKAYDKLTQMGIPLNQQRIGPLAVERVLGFGQLIILKRGWPELFQKFSELHPEARNYL